MTKKHTVKGKIKGYLLTSIRGIPLNTERKRIKIYIRKGFAQIKAKESGLKVVPCEITYTTKK